MREIFPPITLSKSDHTFLKDRLKTKTGILNETLTFLEHELKRASVVPDSCLPATAAALKSKVTYTDLQRGKTRTIVLSAPEDADMETNHVSVMSPVGAALLGLSEGQVIGWQTWTGIERMILLERVNEPSPFSAPTLACS